MTSFLDKILSTTRADLQERKKHRSLAELKDAAAGAEHRDFRAALAAGGVSLIAEIKRASPSKGTIRADVDVAAIAREYEKAGAAAISVLTEERHFMGSLADLRQARNACSLPLLRKDFIIDPYQVWEAAATGADSVLLIVAALTADELRELYREAADAGLECLVEVHDGNEMELARETGATIIGVNNRNLSTFEVSIDTSVRLAAAKPPGTLLVGESGISSAADVALLSQAGVDAILVGETLMTSRDPGATVRELLSGSR